MRTLSKTSQNMPDAIYFREAGRLEKVSYDADVYMPKDARHAIFKSPPLLSRGLIFAGIYWPH